MSAGFLGHGADVQCPVFPAIRSDAIWPTQEIPALFH